MHNHKQPFNLRWKQIEPLYRQSSPRLKLTEIAARLNITPSQVSRVVRRATDNGLVERRRNATAQFRGMNFGTLRRALIPHSPLFLKWVQQHTLDVSVSEFAISIMLDAYYEEIEEAEQETSA
jgi:hypothetical protein